MTAGWMVVVVVVMMAEVEAEDLLCEAFGLSGSMDDAGRVKQGCQLPINYSPP